MSEVRAPNTECTRVDATIAAMDAIALHAWKVAAGAETIQARAAIAVGYMQSAATLHAAEIHALALNRLSASLAPSIESLAELLGLAFDD